MSLNKKSQHHQSHQQEKKLLTHVHPSGFLLGAGWREEVGLTVHHKHLGVAPLPTFRHPSDPLGSKVLFHVWAVNTQLRGLQTSESSVMSGSLRCYLGFKRPPTSSVLTSCLEIFKLSANTEIPEIPLWFWASGVDVQVFSSCPHSCAGSYHKILLLYTRADVRRK